MAHRKVVLCLLGATLAASLFSGCSGKKSDPVTVTVWTYYNGDQLDTFKDLTEKFNDTVGKKDGITVETKSLGTAEDLEQNVLAAADGEVGASEVPNIFSAYSDTAYTMDQKDMLVDLSGYLTDKEKSEYVEEYLKEGDFSDDGSIKIFPVAKSTELLFLMIQTGREFRQRYLDIRSQLVLEITEQEFLSKEALERKTSKGFLGAVALDDYGSGYNSEKSLLALSPKYIKVDMVIIRDIDTDIDKQQIVANIVKYAHQRGMYIVAEGVETAEELKKVLELEVDLLQGYYLSRPAATPGAINPDALKIIEENRKR